jgi:ADP-ribose pyrophosphatase
MRLKKWQTLSSKVVLKNKRFKVVHHDVIQPDGRKSTYDVVEKKDFVVIIPRMGRDYYLIKQYRYAVRALSWECPAGAIEATESPAAAAKRELLEETGLKSKNLVHLGYLWEATGFSNIGFHVYFADKCSLDKQRLEGSEADLIVKRLSLIEIKKMIKNGVIKDAASLAALSLYLFK